MSLTAQLNNIISNQIEITFGFTKRHFCNLPVCEWPLYSQSFGHILTFWDFTYYTYILSYLHIHFILDFSTIYLLWLISTKFIWCAFSACAFSALTLLVGRQEGHPAYIKLAGRASGLYKTEWWGAGVVICLERGADLHMAQLMPLPLTVSCSSKIQIGFTFLVPAHLGSPGQRGVKRVCVCSYDSIK